MASLHEVILRELEIFIEPLMAAADDLHARKRLFSSAMPELSEQDIDALAAGNVEAAFLAVKSAFETFFTAGAPPPADIVELATWLEQVENLVALTDSLEAALTRPAFADVASRLLDYLLLDYLERTHRWFYGLLVMLTVIRARPLDLNDLPPAFGTGLAAYRSAPYFQLELPRFSELLSDPASTIGDAYLPQGDVTLDDVARVEAQLFPWLLVLAGELGFELAYDLLPAQEADVGDGIEVLLRSRTLLLARSFEDGDRISFSLGIARSPSGVVFVVEPLAEITIAEATAGRWLVSFDMSSQGRLLLSADGLLSQQPETEATLSLTRVPESQSDSALVIGGPTGSRLQIASLRFAANLLATGNTLDAGILLEAGDASLVLQPSDGFLSSLLPDGGASVDFHLGLGWSRRRGFYLAGGNGLTATIPLNLSLGEALQVPEITIGLTPEPGGLQGSIRTTLGTNLGPMAAVVDGLGLRTRLRFRSESDTNPAPLRLSLSPLPPRGAGLSLEVGPVEGGGFVSYTPKTGRYLGAMELQIGTLALTAFGIIDTQMPDGSDGFSMLVLVTGRFTPIPIGFGFTLNGLGGLLGIHRDVDVDALFAAIRAGTARDLLAPEDPVREAPRLARQAGTVFPVARGQHVFGPTLQLGWGSPKQVITLDLGLAVTLPDPLRFILIGTVRAVLPEEKLWIARLNVDIAGVLDLSASRFDLEGRIYDSVIQALPITGGFAMRSSWGRDRSFAFSIGGVHPGFTPPANFPTLDRMGVDLSRGSSFQFRLGGYFAITSNSLQLGARADLKVRQAGFTVLADIGFDALFIFDPFGMDLQIYAGASIKRGNTTLLSIRIEARLRGPGPWRVSGSVSFSILLLKVSVGISKTFGKEPSELVEAVNGVVLIEAALTAARSWIAEGASHAGDIVLEDLGEALGPYSPLAVQQKVAPLELQLDQLGGRRLNGPRRFEILRLEMPAGDLLPHESLKGAFAPAQFTEMTEQERLSAPSFEDLVAGASFAGDDVVDADGALTADISMEMIILDAPPPSRFAATRLRREMVIAHQPQAVSRSQPAQVPRAAITVRSESWVATDGALGATGEPGTHAQLRQEFDGAVLARAGEVSA